MVLDLKDTLLAFLVLWVFIVSAYTASRWGREYYIRRRSRVTQKRIVTEMLELAMDQRNIFRLELQSNEFKGYRIEGLCTKFDQQHIYLDTSGAFVSQKLRGEQALVYFQNMYRKKRSFFQFYTHITHVENRGGRHILRLAMPTALDTGQKRSFFRLTPAQDVVLGLGIWPMQGMSLPHSIAQLPPAPLHFLPDSGDNISLTDVSAGGMHIILGNQIEIPPQISKGAPILCLLRLKTIDPDHPPLIFWFITTVVMYTVEHDNSHSLSLRFSSWALTEAGQKNISWFPVLRDEGVPPLSAWLMRHHLEQTKNL